MALAANNDYNATATASDDGAGWLTAAAGAIALAYGAGYALGTVAHHIYDALGGHPQAIAMAPADYNSADFSKFDN
jgi:hypothetical protein